MPKGDAENLSLPTIPLHSTGQPVGTGIARSPSHESFATDLSLMSLSSLGSEVSRLRFTVQRPRSSSEDHPHHQHHRHSLDDPLRRSPNILERGSWTIGSARGSQRGSRNSLLQVPNEGYGGGGGGTQRRPLSGDILFEEETEAIRSCRALSSVLGLMKSFSTSDIDNIAMDTDNLRLSVSEVALTGWSRFTLPVQARLECTSRSCSTWVAVGDISSTSQLPSPQAHPGHLSGESPAITAADFIRSVNKKIRQMYIRRRVLSTYKALERLTQSELTIDSREQTPAPAESQTSSTTAKSSGTATPACTVVPAPAKVASSTDANPTSGTAIKVTPNNPPVVEKTPRLRISSDLDRSSLSKELGISSLSFRGANKTLSLTVKDIERDKGKPLTKYERNMMIFNWLQSLDENSFDQLS